MSQRSLVLSTCLFTSLGLLVACSGSDSGPATPGAGGVVSTVGGGTSTGTAVGTGTGIGGATGLGAGGAAPGLGGASAGLGGVAASVGGASSAAGGATAASGGAVTVGGATAKGGATSAGGAMSAGGTTAKGGATSAGGTTAKGGATSAGGTTAKGGATSAGGTTAKGGATSAGGTTAKGGTTSAGGTASVGGSSGACTPPLAGSKSKNPLFTDVYTADPGALVYNCTFYINCGHDEGSGNNFAMYNWFILKSTDMVNWTRVNNALTLSQFKWANANAWASQMVTKNGKFYWFVPVNKTGSCPNNCGMAIGVAVGDSPEGPFTDYLGKPLIDDLVEMANWNYTLDSDTPYTIDPTVFVDDDGQVYMHYGSFGRVSAVKLNLDGNNVSLSGKIATVSGMNGFFEAPFLTKINGTYYEIYAAGANPAAIDYATSTNPMGPFTYRGRILDPLPTSSTDAATSHPAVAQFAGQWYLVYHISNGPNGGGTYHRQVAVDKITVAANGTIAKITPTSGMQF